MRHLQSLHKFVSRATAELIWLNEKEEEELAYDWSDNNPNISAKKNYFSVSLAQQTRHIWEQQRKEPEGLVWAHLTFMSFWDTTHFVGEES